MPAQKAKEISKIVTHKVKYTKKERDTLQKCQILIRISLEMYLQETRTKDDLSTQIRIYLER